MSTLEGKLVANNMKVGIVVARFNEFITNKLLGGAMDGLLRHDVKEEDITVAWVPGACRDLSGCRDPRKHKPLRLCLQ